MKKFFQSISVIFLCLFVCCRLSAQSRYTDYNAMMQKINSLRADHPALCSVSTLVKTAGGKEIMVITIGAGDTGNKPAVAILGGIEGSYLPGTEIALGFAENILRESSDPGIKQLLSKLTFYVIPNVSPDASGQFFSQLKYERNINALSTDDDRDFVFGEDPSEDLNNDGLITLMRVTDPSGNYIESADDSRIMVPADLAKGESGKYKIFSEGLDNDKDGLFNEDGEGGVNFNRNFSFNYEEFGMNTGFHAVSEPETKAVADFLYDHFNIYSVFSFGPQDNLGQQGKTSGESSSGSLAEESSSGSSPRIPGDRRITRIMKTDEPVLKLVSDKFREITGLKGYPETKSGPGNFSDWAYFHYGRYSFCTPGWWIPSEKPGNTEAAFLKYAMENKLTDPFVPWTVIKHPDFPSKKVEVGGMKPFVMINPPTDQLNDIITKNYKFLVAAANLHPELEFLDTKTEDLGNDIFRISLKVHNKGLFATCAEIGDNNLWTRIMRIIIEPSEGQSLLSGQKIQKIKRLTGDSSAEFSWLVSGKGPVRISAGAINTGTINTSLDLR